MKRARGIQQVAIAERLPIIFGVLTTNTEQQAWDRTGGSHGLMLASALPRRKPLEMISVLATIFEQTPTAKRWWIRPMDKHEPISEFPAAAPCGAQAAALSCWGGCVSSFSATSLGSLEKMAKEGDVSNYQVGPWDYWFFVHPDAVGDLLVGRDAQMMKGPTLRRTEDTLGKGLLTSEGDLHKRQRRLIQPDLHPQRVATYADSMTRYAAETAKNWRDGQEIDLHAEMMELTLRIVAKTLFDADMGDEVHAIGHAMDISVGMFSRAMTPWGPLLDKLPLPSNFRFKRARRRLTDTVDRFIRDHRAKGAMGDDLLSRLLKASDTEGDGSGMSDQQLREEAITLFTAGHETTANALTFTLYLLSQHPDVRKQLDAELESVLSRRAARFEDVEHLPFTRAVLAEGMRPLSGAGLGDAIAKRRKPAQLPACERASRAVVLLSQWVTHRDPRWWPEPTRFDPFAIRRPDSRSGLGRAGPTSRSAAARASASANRSRGWRRFSFSQRCCEIGRWNISMQSRRS